MTDKTYLSDLELIDLVDRIRNVKVKSEREHSHLLNRLKEYARNGGISDYIYHSADDPTVEQIVEKAKEIRNQKPKFLLGHD